MAATPIEGAPPLRSDHRLRAALASWSRGRHRLWSPRVVFSALLLVVLVVGALAVQAPAWVAPTLVVVPVLIGAALLPMTWMVALAIAALVVHSVAVGLSAPAERSVPSVVAFILIVALVLGGARARSRLGVRGSRGELMLFDLREHLTTEGEIPGLPLGWRAEVVNRSANGDSFGGDFLVSAKSEDGSLLEVALVDVSGNGIDAATRALMLAGAFGGLIGSVPAARFLPAANLYLLRQRWDEGFATGVHVAIDLRTGEFELGSAGHPPTVHYHAGSGSWEVSQATGPAFGLFAEAQFELVRGRLLPGDAMLLYTDGLVERPDRDISYGLDRLVGEAEKLVTRGFESGANQLIAAVSDTESDDRACVLIWRR
jgi:hypothetical protein